MRLPSMPDQKLSKYVYLEKILSVFQLIMMSQTSLTTFIK